MPINHYIRFIMRYLSLALLMSLGVLVLFAQQRPHYTQYVMNNYILNPAISGIENYTDLKLSTRQQWLGIDGAPRTFYLTVHGPIGKEDNKGNANSFDMKGENPRGKQYWEEYTASSPHHGIGLNIVNYKTGYINRSFVTANYAYHIGITSRTNLSAGFGLGVSGTSLDRSKVTLATAFDPVINSGLGDFNKFTPELNAGLFLYGASYFLGFSAQQILPTRFVLTDTSLNNSTSVPHLFLTAGYRFFVSEDISMMPSLLLRQIASMPLFTDVNLKMQYRDRFWVGGNYRYKEGFSGMLGVNISQTMNISYSYDVNNSQYLLASMQRGTHEIVLGFLLNNRYGDMCPRNVW